MADDRSPSLPPPTLAFFNSLASKLAAAQAASGGVPGAAPGGYGAPPPPPQQQQSYGAPPAQGQQPPSQYGAPSGPPPVPGQRPGQTPQPSYGSASLPIFAHSFHGQKIDAFRVSFVRAFSERSTSSPRPFPSLLHVVGLGVLSPHVFLVARRYGAPPGAPPQYGQQPAQGQQQYGQQGGQGGHGQPQQQSNQYGCVLPLLAQRRSSADQDSVSVLALLLVNLLSSSRGTSPIPTQNSEGPD